MSMHFEFNQVPNIEIYRSEGSDLVDFHEYTDEAEIVTTVSLGDLIRGLGITPEDCRTALEEHAP